MRRIWKFDLPEMGAGHLVKMPKGARILCVKIQHNTPKIWALVDPDAEKINRKLVIVGTGFTLDNEFDAGIYIDTFFILAEIQLVFHVFDFGEVIRCKQILSG